MSAPLPEEVRRYLDAFASGAPPEGDIDALRFVALDCETTGSDPRRDRLISVGAVAVCGGDIVVEDSFEALLKIDHNRSSVTVHGITRDQAREGADEPAVLLAFLAYLRDAVIVGHHIDHDRTTLDNALRGHFDVELANRAVDTMELTLHLERDGVLPPETSAGGFSLDALCARFDVTPHDRHTAPGDALLTALVFQKLLRLARRHGRATLDRLCERFVHDPE